MPVGLSCSASNSSIDITWEVPDTECPISGFDVMWDYNILWSNNETMHETDTSNINQYSIEEVIPYTDYSVRVYTLVMDAIGDEYANCSAETPQESKGRCFKKIFFPFFHIFANFIIVFISIFSDYYKQLKSIWHIIVTNISFLSDLAYIMEV